MNEYLQISNQLRLVKDKRKKLIEDALDGRTQEWLSGRIDINRTRLSHCINGLMEFEQSELDEINKLLGTNFKVENGTE